MDKYIAYVLVAFTVGMVVFNILSSEAQKAKVATEEIKAGMVQCLTDDGRVIWKKECQNEKK